MQGGERIVRGQSRGAGVGACRNAGRVRQTGEQTRQRPATVWREWWRMRIRHDVAAYSVSSLEFAAFSSALTVAAAFWASSLLIV